MNRKDAQLAIAGILFIILTAVIISVPFMSQAQAEISYNNNLASTPSEIKQKIPLTIEKDSNWQVEWHETYVGLTHREYVVAIQNQKEESSNFALSVIFDSLNFDASQVSNINILEWKQVSKKKPVYETIENCEYPSTIDNETGKVIGNSTSCWSEQKLKGTEIYEAYDWVKVKDTAIEQETSDVKKESYDSVAFEGKQGKEESNIRYFKLGFDVPIVKLSDGSFGSQGRVAFIEGNSGKEYHPWWNESIQYKRPLYVNVTTFSPLYNYTFLINGTFNLGNPSLEKTVWVLANFSVNSTTNNETLWLYYNNNTDFYAINKTESGVLCIEDENLTKNNYCNPWGSYVLVLHFNGTNASTIFNDSSPSHKVWNATFGNSRIEAGSKVFGIGSGYFDGSGDYVTFPDSTDWDFGTGDFTIEFWLKFHTIKAVDSPIIDVGRYDAGISIGHRNSTKVMLLTTNSNGYTANYTPELNKWDYIVITRENGIMRMFVNGTQSGSNITATDDIQTSTGVMLATIQHNPAINGDIFLDELRISKGTARSNEWIMANYRQGVYRNSELGVEQLKITPYATESQGDAAILQGIADSTINPATTYTSQQVYMRNVTGQQKLGRFDVLAVNGSQRWAFNYVSSSESTSNFTYMVNITPSLYVWEATNLTAAQIQEQVTVFINSTKT